MTNGSHHWQATAWCVLSYSSDREDLVSEKSLVTWESSSDQESEAWGEFMENSDPFEMKWPGDVMPDLTDEDLLVEDWEYENAALCDD